MNSKKLLPILLLVVMAVVAFSIKRCRNTSSQVNSSTTAERTSPTRATNTRVNQSRDRGTNVGDKAGLDRNATDLFFTKHAKCRMKCRHITQQEVKDILAIGDINYNKSDLQDPRGPTYAVEGVTRDRQKVRIIFAPKQQHMTVVTVIDLEVEYECSCP